MSKNSLDELLKLGLNIENAEKIFVALEKVKRFI